MPPSQKDHDVEADDGPSPIGLFSRNLSSIPSFPVGFVQKKKKKYKNKK